MCRSFQERAPGHLTALRAALRDADAARLREAAHKFAGTLAVFSTTAGDAASALEEHAAHGRLAEAGPLVEELEGMTRDLTQLAGRLSLDDLAPATGGDAPRP
jgi:HPt (histidine-containing phosphotransfer) domain-containing protein